MSIVNSNKSLPSQLVVGFENTSFSKTKGFLVPRFWLVKNHQEFMDMVNYVCNIDLVVHPEVKTYPAIFELTNNKGPVLSEVSEIYFRECLSEHKKTADLYEMQYAQKFTK